MGYFLTTEPETAVPANSRLSPKTHTPASPVKERGHRYFQPEIGRWLSRDPIGEVAFIVRRFTQGSLEDIILLLEVSHEARNLAQFSKFYRQNLVRRIQFKRYFARPVEMHPAYGFVRNEPMDNYDANGDIGHIAAGAIAGCAAGATFSLVTSWMGGDSACQCTCKAFGACGVGAMAGALTAANPAWGGCLAGLAGSTISTLVSSGCDSLCGQSGEQKPLCVVLSILITTAAGCALPAGSVTTIEQYVLQLVGEIVGFDVSAYCNLLST